MIAIDTIGLKPYWVPVSPIAEFTHTVSQYESLHTPDHHI